MTSQNLTDIISRIEKLEEGVEKLTEVVFSGVSKKPKKKQVIFSSEQDVKFSLNERAFVRRYVRGKSGPKKFTFLLAYIIKGELGENVGISEIKKCWGRMKSKSLLGQFNMFYVSEAKTRGWINSGERGNYSLTEEWKNIL